MLLVRMASRTHRSGASIAQHRIRDDDDDDDDDASRDTLRRDHHTKQGAGDSDIFVSLLCVHTRTHDHANRCQKHIYMRSISHLRVIRQNSNRTHTYTHTKHPTNALPDDVFGRKGSVQGRAFFRFTLQQDRHCKVFSTNTNSHTTGIYTHTCVHVWRHFRPGVTYSETTTATQYMFAGKQYAMLLMHDGMQLSNINCIVEL